MTELRYSQKPSSPLRRNKVLSIKTAKIVLLVAICTLVSTFTAIGISMLVLDGDIKLIPIIIGTTTGLAVAISVALNIKS